ncbi:solute carrier family 23 member 1-like isoform X2 [Littorina saxatilis]|uniref:solute carrier family 23 member 1-like isoform X2 n=1 Tax=Littorina saxatilis TaxID=31220 RepID=UPI0038B64287
MTEPDKKMNGQEPSVEVDMGKSAEAEQGQEKLDILYKVDETPPIPLLIVLGFQQFLTMFGATFSFPLLMAGFLCMKDDTVGISQLISTVIFVAGLSTIIQTVFGVRLAIIQSVSYSFITPFIVLLSLPKWTCKPCVIVPAARSLAGGLAVPSGGGLHGFGGSPAQLHRTSHHRSHHRHDRSLPLRCRVWQVSRAVVDCSNVLLAVIVAWLLCYIFTITDVFPSVESKKWGYLARTDLQSDVIGKAPWFRFPYPGQWGMPTVSVEGVLGCLAAIIASIVESVGDYYACARLSGAPPPPGYAVTRGIGVEGITCLIAGAWGSGGGTTSYSENIGAIGITKVGSRSVVQVSGVIMIVMACVGKFSAIFVAIPEPVVGGLFLVMFGMVTAVGISNLQYVDLNSSRNLFILGVSLFVGLSLPKWLSSPANANVIDTGSAVVDNIFTVLCSTSMFVAGAIAFFLDNTMPGTLEERGINKWRLPEDSKDQGELLKVYDLPLIQSWLNKRSITKYLPFCPGFKGFGCRGNGLRERNGYAMGDGIVNSGFETNNQDRQPGMGGYSTQL